MIKVAFIGAGSVVFTRNLISDLLSYPELNDIHITLMDIDPERLSIVDKLVQKLVAHTDKKIQVEATMERKKALKDASYVFVSIQVGGIDVWKLDIDIPSQYGVGQCVGDTLGPGGVFRGLRHMAVIDDIARDMEELCPDAIMLQYANPMAMICWSLSRNTGIRFVGLCHSVQDTAEMLARFAEVPYEELNYWVAGINHMAWFLKLECQGKDLYPAIRKKLDDFETYSTEPVRFDLFRHFGYYVTESSAHASEYFPYFRKRKDLLEQLVRNYSTPKYKHGKTGGCIEYAYERLDRYLDSAIGQIEGRIPIEIKRSREYGARIVHAIETNTPCRINGNVFNDSLISNLPYGSCVEVPCLVDAAGIHPVAVGKLPPALAALNRTNIHVQELAVEGHSRGDRQAIKEALMLDPLTAAVCSLDEISQMTDDLFKAQKEYLPQFSK